MPELRLKSYQQLTLDTLRNYFKTCGRLLDPGRPDLPERLDPESSPDELLARLTP